MKLLKIIDDSRKKKEKAKKVKAAKKMATAATVGSAVGAIAGVLLAPKSGKETRQDIVNNVKSTSENVRNSARDIKEKAVGVQNKLKSVCVLGKANKLVADIKEKKLQTVEVPTQERDSDEE
jgi:gas vesicle protein